MCAVAWKAKSYAVYQLGWHGKISKSIHLWTENLCLSHGPGCSNNMLPEDAQAFVSPRICTAWHPDVGCLQAGVPSTVYPVAAELAEGAQGSTKLSLTSAAAAPQTYRCHVRYGCH